MIIDRVPMECGVRSWYALRVWGKYESRVFSFLTAKGFETFLPLWHKKRRWTDRTVASDVPLFPGYMFCRLDISDRMLPILTTPGVIGFVSAGKTPVSIPDKEIDAVRQIVDSGVPASPSDFVTTGSRIVLESGPLKGLSGLVVRLDKDCRMIVSVELLQRSVQVEIEGDWIREPMPQSPPRGYVTPLPSRSFA